MAKRSREERDQELVDAVEQIMGFPFLPWQRRVFLTVMEQRLTGKPVKIDRRAIETMRKF